MVLLEPRFKETLNLTLKKNSKTEKLRKLIKSLKADLLKIHKKKMLSEFKEKLLHSEQWALVERVGEWETRSGRKIAPYDLTTAQLKLKKNIYVHTPELVVKGDYVEKYKELEKEIEAEKEKQDKLNDKIYDVKKKLDDAISSLYNC